MMIQLSCKIGNELYDLTNLFCQNCKKQKVNSNIPSYGAKIMAKGLTVSLKT